MNQSENVGCVDQFMQLLPSSSKSAHHRLGRSATQDNKDQIRDKADSDIRPFKNVARNLRPAKLEKKGNISKEMDTGVKQPIQTKSSSIGSQLCPACNISKR